MMGQNIIYNGQQGMPPGGAQAMFNGSPQAMGGLMPMNQMQVLGSQHKMGSVLYRQVQTHTQQVMAAPQPMIPGMCILYNVGRVVHGSIDIVVVSTTNVYKLDAYAGGLRVVYKMSPPLNLASPDMTCTEWNRQSTDN